MENLRLKNSGKVVIGHINNHSLKNKFQFLIEIFRDKVDFLNKAQFFVLHEILLKTIQIDRNRKERGIILYARKDIPSKLINSSCIDHDKEYFLVELNFRKQKRLIICNYNCHKTMIKEYLEYISKENDSHSSKYDNFLLLDDFNSEPTEEAMKSFCQYIILKTYYINPHATKTPIGPSWVNLIITNKQRSFQNSCRFETRLSEFHKMILKVLKSPFAKQKTKSTKLPQL